MNKLILIIGILLISSVSALTLYGGESYSFEVDFIEPVYIVTGNSSNLEGLNIIFNGTHIELNFAQNYKPDNFTLIFFDKEVKEVTKEIRVGGGTRTIYEDRNITEYIDVPHYIETEIEVEKEIDPEIIKEIPAMTLFLIYFLVGLILWLIYKYYQKSNRIERRSEEEQNE